MRFPEEETEEPVPPTFAAMREELLAQQFDDDELAPAVQLAAAPRTAPAPRGYGAELGDAALKSAQAKAAKATDRADWNRIGKSFTGTLLGRRPDTTLADSIDAQGKRGVENVLQRRQGLGQEEDFKAKQRATAINAEDDDPASKASLDIVGLASQAVPSMAGSIKGMSRTQVLRVMPFMEKIEARQKEKGKKQMDAQELKAAQDQVIADHPDLDPARVRLMSFDTLKPFMADQRAKESAAAQLKATGIAQNRADDASRRAYSSELRKEFNGLPEVKTFKDVQTEYEKLKGALGSASMAGDIAGVTAFMKLLDPGSTVRESEFANAQGATSAINKMENYVNQLRGQGRLNPQQRQDFLRQATIFMDAHKKATERAAMRYRALAESAGLTPDDVTGQASQPAPGLTPEEAKELAELEALEKAGGLK